MSLPPEFALIARHFRRLAGEGALDLSDDAAILAPPAGRELVLAADALVEGVHYLSEDPPETIGRKLLRVNLSDLAAMGAEPLAYLMTTALPHGTSPEWLEEFTAGLAADQREFGLHVLGGDTVSVPGPACLSLTIIGTVPPGAALRRAGARPGDDLWVSGTIGDGALGLAVLQGRGPADPEGYLARRYRLPEPRLALGAALRGLARATMDVSDGLAQDLAHLCRAGGLGAVLELAALPLSAPAAALAAKDPSWLSRLASGGDDYELLFAADPADADRVKAAASAAGTPVTRIGHFVSGEAEVTVLNQDRKAVDLQRGGWSHF
ncbi:thiamine-phosphate kinase [Roseomonas xinghualingensis]|uniref:thiamine-phosphate kinase n=1 Tax=Roseomonas xinghualingensis TaxID=2986475 RepID=UPI0021F1B6A1|nr:thiamine-phosphate kinase [Roseomonas sp. SXEYE001]MCV4206870.1 thiamine-phosphate kinase [Roseomonas sp. SXEYE001]